MILENYYHILWLDSSSSQKQISKRSKDILKYLAIGEIPDFESDLSSIEKYRNEIYVKSALDNLSNPKEKLLHSFFWFEIEDESDKNIFSLINDGKDGEVTELVKASGNKKNLALLYSLFLLEPNVRHEYTYSAEDSIQLFKEIQDDDIFWKHFEKKYFLFDDTSADKQLISDLRKSLGTHLSNLYYDISVALEDDGVLKTFHKYFKNTKGSKTVEKVEKIYLELHKLAWELKEMNISEDGVFDDDEKKELKKLHKNIKKYLKELSELWLYEDSKTLIVRDTVAESFRVIMLDLNNELDEENEALKVLHYALDVVGTEGLKHQIQEEHKTISENIKLKPVIQLLNEEDFIEAYNEIERLEEEDLSEQDEINLEKLKKRTIFWRLGKWFITGKDLFEAENYIEAKTYFNQTEALAEDTIHLFDGINADALSELIWNIRAYIVKVEKWKLNIEELFEYIDTLRASILERLDEEDGYFFIFYIDSVSYGYLSELNLSKTKYTLCHFCNQDEGSENLSVPVKMYKVVKNFNIIIYRNKQYKQTQVDVPICEKCNEVRSKNAAAPWKAFFISLIASIALMFMFGEDFFFILCIWWIIWFFVLKKNAFMHEDSSRVINPSPENYEVVSALRKEKWIIWEGPQ